MHLFLQSWTEGEVPEEFALLLTPERGGLNEELLSRGTTTQEWAQAWQTILATKTHGSPSASFTLGAVHAGRPSKCRKGRRRRRSQSSPGTPQDR